MRDKKTQSLKIQICEKCIMDTTAEDIIFDNLGRCNFCKDFEKRKNQLKNNKNDLNELLNAIKKDGKNKKYDCIVGVSGGVDSSFSLLKAYQLGLRPLATTALVGEVQFAPPDLPANKSPKSCELPRVAIVMNCILLK